MRRSVEQFEQEAAGRQLAQRGHRRMGEAGVGALADPQQGARVDLIAGEEAENLGGDLGVGPAGEGGDLARAQRGPGGGGVEAAVAGQTGQQHVDEAGFGGATAGRNVSHGLTRRMT